MPICQPVRIAIDFGTSFVGPVRNIHDAGRLLIISVCYNNRYCSTSAAEEIFNKTKVSHDPDRSFYDNRGLDSFDHRYLGVRFY